MQSWITCIKRADFFYEKNILEFSVHFDEIAISYQAKMYFDKAYLRLECSKWPGFLWQTQIQMIDYGLKETIREKRRRYIETLLIYTLW